MDIKIKILSDFQKSLVAFLDELIEMFPSESDFILARIFIKDKVSIIDIVSYFNTFIMPYKNEIKNRNKNIVIEKIFAIGNVGSVIPSCKIERYSNIYDSLSEDDKTIVWSWIDMFIDCIEKYTSPVN